MAHIHGLARIFIYIFIYSQFVAEIELHHYTHLRFSATLFLSRVSVVGRQHELGVELRRGKHLHPKSPHSTLGDHWDDPLSSISLETKHLFLMTNEIPMRNL